MCGYRSPVHPCGRWSLPRLLPRFLSPFSPFHPNLIHNLLLSSSPRVTSNLPNVGAMGLALPFPRLFLTSSFSLPYLSLVHDIPFSVFRTDSLPWCQRLHSLGPFESHPREGLEKLDREGMSMERGALRLRKRERETACYGRDGPFARRCSKRARKGEGGKLLELGIFTRLGQAKHVSPTHPRFPASFDVGATESNREGQDRLS